MMERTSTSTLISDPADLRQHIGKCVLLIFKTWTGIDRAYESLSNRPPSDDDLVNGRWDLGSRKYGVFSLEGNVDDFIAWLAEISQRHEIEISVDDSPETRKLLAA